MGLKIDESIWEDSENIYKEDSVDMLLDDDCITPEEEGFMKGYVEAM